MGNLACCIPHANSDHNFDGSAIYLSKRGEESGPDLPHISEREGIEKNSNDLHLDKLQCLMFR